MKIAFRTTASPEIGYGHLRRCLTLARASRAECIFFLREDAHALVEGFEARVWSRSHGCDLLVCDDYSLDDEDVRGAMVLDDPMMRRLTLARWIVNPTPSVRYASPAAQLLGPRYALLSEAFARMPKKDTSQVNRVLVTLGGADPHGKTLEICKVLQGYALDVVVGPMFSPALVEQIAALPVTVHHQPRSLAALMTEASLCICAGGQTVYEAAAAGLPALALQVATNQRLNLQALSELGVLKVTTAASVAADLHALADDAAARAEMSKRGQTLVDGMGAQRVAEALR